MYRHCFELKRVVVAAALAVAVLLGGCAAPGGVPGSPRAPDDPAEATPERPVRPARVQVDAGVGFTVTEVVSLPGDARVAYREALARIAQEDYEAGIALLLEVTGKAPDATAPHVDLGIAYARSGALDEAVASFQRALAATPKHPVANNELGIVYRRLGRFAEARTSYERALQVYPGFHFARRNLAVLCDLFLGDLECALEHYEIYRELVPDDAEVEIWIGDIRNRIGPAG